MGSAVVRARFLVRAVPAPAKRELADLKKLANGRRAPRVTEAGRYRAKDAEVVVRRAANRPAVEISHDRLNHQVCSSLLAALQGGFGLNQGPTRTAPLSDGWLLSMPSRSAAGHVADSQVWHPLRYEPKAC